MKAVLAVFVRLDMMVMATVLLLAAKILMNAMKIHTHAKIINSVLISKVLSAVPNRRPWQSINDGPSWTVHVIVENLFDYQEDLPVDAAYPAGLSMKMVNAKMLMSVQLNLRTVKMGNFVLMK